MESDERLHEYLQQTFGFERISVDGSTKTKGDAFGHLPGVEQPVTISIKHPSGKNTQVHLPTLSSWRDATQMPDIVFNTLQKWLGTTDWDLWNSWTTQLPLTAKEEKYQRIGSYQLSNWPTVLDWLNQVTRSKVLPELLIQSINGDHPVKYLVWIRKKTGSFDIVDVDAFVDWISKNGQWINSTNKLGQYYNLWCVGPDGRKIFSLQMKGSGGKDGGYDHSPQFHLYPFWPVQFILHSDILPKLST